jgi:hypothetical protein
MDAMDAMVVATAWLEAYRRAELTKMIDLHDDDASLECACSGRKIIVGKPAIAAYWRQRFADTPLLEVEDLQREGAAAMALYRIAGGAVQALLDVDELGKIRRVRCGQVRRVRAPAR